MTTATRLTLFAPGFQRQIRASDVTEAPTSLELLAGRGRFSRIEAGARCGSLQAWQEHLLQALGIEANDLASAPLTAIGAGVDASGAWLHATFVHLAAGLDHLVLIPLHEEQTLEARDRSVLAAHIREDLLAAGFEWTTAANTDLLRCELLDVQTCDPETAARMPLTDAMPRGKDALRLRRLMTEVQMRLHEHPVNGARARNGLLPANALWLWGAGTVATIAPQRQWPTVFADDEFTKGVCNAAGQPCRSLPEVRALTNADEAIAVVRTTSLNEMERVWFGPLASMLRSGAMRELTLMLDNFRIDVDSGFRYRFWRKPLRFETWMKAQ